MGAEKLITVIVPQGRGIPLLKSLYERKVLRAALGTARAPFTYVKGSGTLARTVRHSMEKDVLHVVVPAEDADETFSFLYASAGIGDAVGGFMFMGALSRASVFTLERNSGSRPASGEPNTGPSGPGSDAASARTPV